MIKFFKFIPLWRGKKNKEEKGFTLVEMLVAISIFTVSVIAMMSFLSQSISNTNNVKKRIVAVYLAQEGIEYIRNMRDTYMLYSTNAQIGWTAFVSTLIPLPNTLCAGTNGCYLNADNLFSFISQPMPITKISLTACADATCSVAPLFYDSTTGKYNNSSLGVNSGFTRKIFIKQITNKNGGLPQEIQVFSTVYWTQGTGTYNVSFSESLLDWIEQ